MRLEYKYYMPSSSIDSLRRDILPYLKPDSFAADMPNYEYTVRSIYLDSLNLHTYHEKHDGVKIRNKYRIRGYNKKEPDSLVFLEIKRKDTDYVWKDRVPVLYERLNDFIVRKDFNLIYNGCGRLKAVQTSARNFFYYYSMRNLIPIINVTYEREAYECKFGSGLRITFDKNIKSRFTNTFSNLYDDGNMNYLFEDCFVLEVKYGKILPSWVPAVLNKYNLFRMSISKYVIGVDTSSTKNKLCHFN